MKIFLNIFYFNLFFSFLTKLINSYDDDTFFFIVKIYKNEINFNQKQLNTIKKKKKKQ